MRVMSFGIYLQALMPSQVCRGEEVVGVKIILNEFNDGCRVIFQNDKDGIAHHFSDIEYHILSSQTSSIIVKKYKHTIFLNQFG